MLDKRAYEICIAASICGAYRDGVNVDANVDRCNRKRHKFVHVCLHRYASWIQIVFKRSSLMYKIYFKFIFKWR